MRLHLVKTAVLVMIASLLGACDNTASLSTTGRTSANTTSTTTSIVAPTATTAAPVIPTTHTIVLGNYQFVFIQPAIRGLILVSSAQGKPIDQSKLYFYDYSTQTTRLIAQPTPAPDGTLRGMDGGLAAGDWIVYEETDDSGAHWSIRAVNVVTDEDRLVDSYIQENDQFSLTHDNAFAADGNTIVWATTDRSVNPFRGVLHMYDLATNTAHILQTAPGNNRYEDLLLHGTMLFYTLVEVMSGATTPYLWDLSQPAPQQETALNGRIDDFSPNYFAWSDTHNQTLAIVVRTTGQERDGIAQNCIRPAISQDRPYAVCLDFNHFQFQLVRLPSGAETPFAVNQADGGQFGTLFNDRVFWLVFPNEATTSNEAAYFDLPQG
jgi:hypothetical protein